MMGEHLIVECHGCGEDCSNAYGTWHGYPYHIGCIPAPIKKRTVLCFEGEELEYEPEKGE